MRLPKIIFNIVYWYTYNWYMGILPISVLVYYLIGIFPISVLVYL